MKTIPIYDATEAVACTIDAKDVHAHLELIERMRCNLEHVDRTEHGLLLSFPRRAEVEADARTFAVVEKGCCRFWGFDVEVTADRVHLRWDGPPATDGFMDRLLDAFEGDDPITAIGGLL